MTTEETMKTWSEKVAGLGVDTLVDHGLIKKEDFERATSIVAEEIWVRLTMGDYPPSETMGASPDDPNQDVRRDTLLAAGVRMTKDEFRQFVSETLEAVIQLAEKETGSTLSRKLAFKWFSQESAPVREGIVEHITDRVFIDEDHIYPCVDIGVGDVLDDGTVLITANIAGYAPRPFQKNWTGKDGPFVYMIGQKTLDKLTGTNA